MRQIVWLGALLIVPLAAVLLWWGDVDEKPRVRGARESIALEAEPKIAERPSRPSLEEPPASLDADNTAVEELSEPEELAELLEDDLEEEGDHVERARRIRLPVILAIRGNHPTGEARREAMLDALRNSGASEEDWTRQAVTVFDKWTNGLSTDIGHRLNWSSAKCFQAGCEVELSFPDRPSYERAAREFRTLHEEGAAHGGRVQTPATESEEGELVVSWIMMRPDGSPS